MSDPISFDQDLWDLATRYRKSLRQMWDEVRFHTAGCQCDLRDDWDILMDSGIDKRSPELTNDGVTCLACRIEGIYELAVGPEIFDAETITELRMRLGDHSVISQTFDESGKLHYQIVKREAVDKIDLEMYDQDDDPDEDDF